MIKKDEKPKFVGIQCMSGGRSLVLGSYENGDMLVRGVYTERPKPDVESDVRIPKMFRTWVAIRLREGAGK